LSYGRIKNISSRVLIYQNSNIKEPATYPAFSGIALSN